MRVDELRALLETLPGHLPVTFRANFHVNIPVAGHVLIKGDRYSDDQVVLTPYATETPVGSAM